MMVDVPRSGGVERPPAPAARLKRFRLFGFGLAAAVGVACGRVCAVVAAGWCRRPRRALGGAEPYAL